MKKTIAIVLLAVLLCGAAYGIVTVSWGISDSYSARMFAAFNAQDGCEMHITIHDPNGQYQCNTGSFTLTSQGAIDPNETAKQYGKRRIERIIKKVVRSHEQQVFDANEVDRVSYTIANPVLPIVTEPNSIED